MFLVVSGVKKLCTNKLNTITRMARSHARRAFSSIYTPTATPASSSITSNTRLNTTLNPNRTNPQLLSHHNKHRSQNPANFHTSMPTNRGLLSKNNTIHNNSNINNYKNAQKSKQLQRLLFGKTLFTDGRRSANSTTSASAATADNNNGNNSTHDPTFFQNQILHNRYFIAPTIDSDLLEETTHSTDNHSIDETDEIRDDDMDEMSDISENSNNSSVRGGGDSAMALNLKAAAAQRGKTEDSNGTVVNADGTIVFGVMKDGSNGSGSSNGGINGKTASKAAENAQVLFDSIFAELAEQFGLENLRFPKDIMWLAGAPGSGKGAMTQFISDQIGNTNPPLMISEILTGPEIESLKKKGELVNDRIVLKILFQRLLAPQYQTGVIVDGFPRTPVQAECINLLFDKMLWLRRRFENTSHFHRFRRPVFHVTVLYIDERKSVERQLQRGKQLSAHNRLVEQTGVGRIKQIRNTDLSAKLARDRYRNFYDNMYASLQIIKEKFPFHFINAERSRGEVEGSIVEELQYQSRNELADTTFDNVRRIPLASEIKLDARHELVRRLDQYQRENGKLFNKVIEIINQDFTPKIKRQALSGQVIIRTENPMLFEDDAIDMILDLLSERGYRIVLDYLREQVPSKIDVETGDVVEFKHKKVLVFNISFPPPRIRHAVQKSTQWETSLR